MELRPVSLRTRLLIGLVGLTVAGLTIASVVVYAAERSFLISRVDQLFAPNTVLGFEGYIDRQLHLGAGPLRTPPPNPEGRYPRRRNGGPPHGGVLGTLTTMPVGTYGFYVAPTGKRESKAFGVVDESPPKLPGRVAETTDLSHSRFITVDSAKGAALQYRVLATSSDTRSGLFVVATPLGDVAQTLARLREIELIVVAAVALALAVVAWLSIRLGLRPLERISTTASAIAAGDLSRRVSPATERTEVGRLGVALNAMFDQIEHAFAERQASEGRLRKFLSDAAHELRTPLTSIRGYAELFRMGAAASPDSLDKVMARIEEEATRMGNLVEDMLSLARLEEMSLTTHDPVHIGRLVLDAVACARTAAGDRAVSVVVDGDHVVHGDESQLRRVLANLTSNALAHSPEGTPIALSLTGSSGVVRVIVRDYGSGLPEGAEQDIFEAFWRAEGGRQRGRAGAGLGLAIVAAIVAAHGGRVTAANAPGGGAEIVVELPCDDV